MDLTKTDKAVIENRSKKGRIQVTCADCGKEWDAKTVWIWTKGAEYNCPECYVRK